MSNNGDRLVGVYRDEDAAREVAEQARRAGATDVRVGDPADEQASLRSEMRDEVENSFVSPQAAFAVTKEGAKGTALLGVIGAVIGVAVTVPLAFLFFDEMSLVARVIAAALVGATAGATVGIIVGPGFTSKGGSDALAVERGVTVSTAASDAAREVLTRAHPIRLDEVSSQGLPVETVTTEADRSGAGVTDAVKDRLGNPEGPAMSGDGIKES